MTDVTFHPTGNVGYQGAPALSSTTVTHTAADASGLEMAAFEKGRMQGEMEAIRRMEAEQGAMQLKQFPAEPAGAVLAAPDVVEINRLTWLQRAAAVLGELAAIASVVLTIVWFMVYRAGFGWSADGDDAPGNTDMWNTGFLLGMLGFFSLSQAILMYRILPLHTPNGMNKLIYYFWQACAAVGFSIFLAAIVMTAPDSTFWGVGHWCYALGFFVWGTHMLYSFFRLCIERKRPVDHETWAEHPNRITFGSPEQRRDHSVANEYGRTLYAPQPRMQGAKRMAAQAAQHAATGTHVPSAMAPRWSELPTHHAEDYFLLPRAKWAVCGYFGITAGMLMILAAVQYAMAAGRSNWAQGPLGAGVLGERSSHSDIISALGLITLASCLLISYAAMPPRTTLIKQNTGMAARRTSISHNAETRVGNIV